MQGLQGLWGLQATERGSGLGLGFRASGQLLRETRRRLCLSKHENCTGKLPFFQEKLRTVNAGRCQDA